MKALYRKTLLTVILVFTALVLPVKLIAGNPIVVKNDANLQGQFKSSNTVYIIRDAIDLKNAKLSIPQNSIIKFEGGLLKNGSIIYNNTYIEGRYKIYCKCSGTLANDIVEPHMYGARGDGKTDDSDAIQKAINSGKSVSFRRSTYVIEKPIVFDRQNFIVDFNFATLKKLNKCGIDYKYENYDFNKIPCVILIKPYASNTSGHIVIRNLIIEGGEANVGVHAIWCRNVILENTRIFNSNQGLVYGGFTNTFRDVTIWASKEGFVINNAGSTLFERCFSSHCGWEVNKSTGISLLTCSSDDFNPCYSFTESTVSMIGCTFESKGLGILINNSVVNISGDYQSHIYDSTKSITYLRVSGGSIVRANGCTFHLNNYMNKKVPDSNLFEVDDSSVLQMEGRVEHGNSLKIKKSNRSQVSINGNALKNGNNSIK